MSLPPSKNGFPKGRPFFLLRRLSLKEKITMLEELCIPNYFFIANFF